jgi:hypothetical protein
MMESYKSEDEQIKAFNDADMNGDGKLSLLEYTKSSPPPATRSARLSPSLSPWTLSQSV